MSVTQNLARLCIGEHRSGATSGELELAKRSLLDTLGVIIAGVNEPATSLVREAAVSALPTGTCTIWTTGEQTDAQHAALINGTSGHSLDYDDITDVEYGHPSVVLWPALLALAEQDGKSGREVLESFCAGFDVIIAVSKLMDVRQHYGRGWHSTATIGILGAAGALAHLKGLSEEKVRIAIGLASTMAGGSRQNFGTMTKPFHVGMTARNAVLAVELADRGFTADAAELDGPLGFFSRFSDGGVRVPSHFWEQAFHRLEHEQVNVKKFPSCYNTQRTADLMLRLAAEHDLDASTICDIEVTTEPGGFDPLIHHRPQTGLQAKFSMEYVIAAAVIDRKVDLRSFENQSVQRDTVQDLMTKVRWGTAAVPPTGGHSWDFAYSVIHIETTTSMVEGRCDFPRGDRRNPLSLEELQEKFSSCVDFSGRDLHVEALSSTILDFENLADVRDMSTKALNRHANAIVAH